MENMSEVQFLGMLILALGTIFSLSKMVVQPLIKAMTDLATKMTTLSMSVDNLESKFDNVQSRIEKNEDHSRESHLRLWKHNEEQDKRLDEHDKRILLLEDHQTRKE